MGTLAVDDDVSLSFSKNWPESFIWSMLYLDNYDKREKKVEDLRSR